jgi:hypothetical protein
MLRKTGTANRLDLSRFVTRQGNAPKGRYDQP